MVIEEKCTIVCVYNYFAEEICGHQYVQRVPTSLDSSNRKCRFSRALGRSSMARSPTKIQWNASYVKASINSDAHTHIQT